MSFLISITMYIFIYSYVLVSGRNYAEDDGFHFPVVKREIVIVVSCSML